MRITAAAKAVRYRVEQFLQALKAEHAISEQRLESAVMILSPEARALFVQQAPQDQSHALAVYETLLESGHANEDLLVAALLHDIGKAATEAPPWRRGVFVLAQRYAPWLLRDKSLDADNDRKGSLVTYAQHAEIGAHWAEKAGCSSRTVELIRHHERRLEGRHTEQDRLLAALQAADSIN